MRFPVPPDLGRQACERIVVSAEGYILCELRRVIEWSHQAPGQTFYDRLLFLAVFQRNPGLHYWHSVLPDGKMR
jgi:hypothetical protein